MYRNKKIGIGLSTYERPEYLKTALKSISNNLSDYVDYLFVCDDGSKNYFAEIKSILDNFVAPFDYEYMIHDTNKSVCVTKNNCLKSLLKNSCDYIFLMENDMEILHQYAIAKYADASADHGIHHLNFAHHGPLNSGPPLTSLDLLETEIIDGIDVYTACVGSWSFYTSECLKTVGLMDEVLRFNSMEHVEHTLRCAKEGFTFRFWRFPDVSGSINYIRPQPNSLESSTIRASNTRWHADMEWSLQYVKEKHPEYW